jgi:hypothetical protein
MLYRSTHRRCRGGAPVKNLAHSASFHSKENNAPSKPGIKQLGRSALNTDTARGPNRSRSSESNRMDKRRPIPDRRRLRPLPSRLSRQDCRCGAHCGTHSDGEQNGAPRNSESLSSREVPIRPRLELAPAHSMTARLRSSEARGSARSSDARARSCLASGWARKLSPRLQRKERITKREPPRQTRWSKCEERCKSS